MSNSRFAQDGQVVHRAKPSFLTPVLQDEHMPARVGSIIGTEWLAVQMGLPVEYVERKLQHAKEAHGQPGNMDR